MSDFAQRFLAQIDDPHERQIVEKYIVKWDEGYRKQERRWQDCQRIADLAVNQPQKLIDLYRSRGILK